MLPFAVFTSTFFSFYCCWSLFHSSFAFDNIFSNTFPVCNLMRDRVKERVEWRRRKRVDIYFSCFLLPFSNQIFLGFCSCFATVHGYFAVSKLTSTIWSDTKWMGVFHWQIIETAKVNTEDWKKEKKTKEKWKMFSALLWNNWAPMYSFTCAHVVKREISKAEKISFKHLSRFKRKELKSTENMTIASVVTICGLFYFCWKSDDHLFTSFQNDMRMFRCVTFCVRTINGISWKHIFRTCFRAITCVSLHTMDR